MITLIYKVQRISNKMDNFANAILQSTKLELDHKKLMYELERSEREAQRLQDMEERRQIREEENKKLFEILKFFKEK